jgi:hypothetical protein
VLLAACGVALATLVTAVILLRGAVAARLHAALAPLAAARARLCAAGATFYLCWLVEALESYLLLRLVGAEISPAQLIALEASITLIRSLAVFVPAGIGFQDAGYLAFLSAFAIPEATQVGTAFLILKRAKEIVWIAVGYAVLAAQAPSRPLSRSRQRSYTGQVSCAHTAWPSVDG